ncbi:MAG: hypothetical protein AAFR04_02445 [Pseudomonadota bacterium]
MRRRSSPREPYELGPGVEHADVGQGGRLATVLSAVALIFSAWSFYESVLKQPQLEVYVPQVVHYARDGGGNQEVMALPVTIANHGANTGTVMALELIGTNDEGVTKRFYAAFIGEFPKDPRARKRSFAPISVPGRSTFSETLLFYPSGKWFPKLIADKGTFRFRLNATTAYENKPGPLSRLLGAGIAPVPFSVVARRVDHFGLRSRRNTQALYAKGFNPTRSQGDDKARSNTPQPTPPPTPR